MHAQQTRAEHTLKTYKCTHRAASKKPRVSVPLIERGHSSEAQREGKGGRKGQRERERESTSDVKCEQEFLKESWRERE